MFIGTDSGPMHIARALEVPCIIIAGAALPYYSNPNREKIFYVVDNSLNCLGCKHKQYFSLRGEQLTFVPVCNNDIQGCCMKTIKPEHVVTSIEKVRSTPSSILTNKPTKFYFNIPKWAYFIDEETDLVQRERLDEHPDQTDDLHEEYSYRKDEIYKKYSVPFIEEVKKHIEPKDHSLLDIGCSVGLVVKAATEVGFDAYGIDINKKSIEKGKELFTEISGKLKLDVEYVYDKKYDVIVCNQTLEHISKPSEFLESWVYWLEKDGMMFLGLPSFDEENAKMLWHRWQTMGKGEHCTIFSNKSFDCLMNKVGLKYEYIQDVSKGILAKCWIRKEE